MDRAHKQVGEPEFQAVHVAVTQAEIPTRQASRNQKRFALELDNA
jgi:hypothetical protein